jgi:hypothetical protein
MLREMPRCSWNWSERVTPQEGVAQVILGLAPP